MYIINGIAYAGEQTQPLRVSGVRPLDDFRLWVRFSNEEVKIFDFKPLFDTPVFAPLSDPCTFNSVYIDYGTAVWNGGRIDISPEMLYEQGTNADAAAPN